MPSIHHVPTADEQAATLAVLDELAQALGYPGVRTYGAGRGLAWVLGVSPSTVCRYARGVRSLSPATVADWRERVAAP